MHIPRHWRLNSQRYALQGVTCSHCNNNIFPPREVCPYCEAQAEEEKAAYDFVAQDLSQPVTAMSAAYELAAR